MAASYFSTTYGAFDLNSRAIEAWPDYGEWALIAELLELTILTEGKYPRLEEQYTNDALACILALWQSRTYVVSAGKRMQRFEKGLTSILGSGPADQADHRQSYVDLHFYFICWSRVEEMTRLVETRSGLGVKLPPADRKELNSYKSARHHLEHHAERLPGGLRMPKPISDALVLGSLSLDVDNRTWQHGAESWDVSARSLERLRGIAFNFEDAILRRALRALPNAY
jgi:hypothetical protein